MEKDDPDGVELHFANAQPMMRSKDSQRLAARARAVRPFGIVDINKILKPLLKAYGERIYQVADQRRRGGNPDDIRPLSVYILTDGRWDERQYGPEEGILLLVNTLKEHGLTRRQVGIQFISFGDDPDALANMTNLDNMSQHFGLDKYAHTLYQDNYYMLT